MLDGELTKDDGNLVVFFIFGDLDEFGFDCLAGSAPWGVEFDNH